MVVVQVYIDTTEQDAVKQPLSEEEKVLPIPRRPGWSGLRWVWRQYFWVISQTYCYIHNC
jgi:hypothetical protein